MSKLNDIYKNSKDYHVAYHMKQKNKQIVYYYLTRTAIMRNFKFSASSRVIRLIVSSCDT